MPNLVLEMRQGDMMVVNGAGIRFRSKTRIELTAHARFLFGKQLMLPQDATTPSRRIYYALQTAYIGNDDEREAGLASARALIAAFQAERPGAESSAVLGDALSRIEAGGCYQALKLCRDVIRAEDGVALGAPPPGPQSSGAVASATAAAE